MRIAVLTGDWNIDIMKEFLHGVDQYAMQHNVKVCVFNCFGADDSKTSYSMGEYNIYTLPEWKDFDAVIMEGNLVYSDDVRQEFWHAIRDAKVPAIVADYEIKGCPFYGVNNYDAMSMVMEHILSVHHCKSVCFVAGPIWHEESNERLQAFLDKMQKYGHPADDSMVYHGDFHLKDGVRIADEILAAGKMPDAIVCANDEMACGVCESLKKHNIQVPKDIIVTGYDGIQEGEDYSPTITTVKRFYYQHGFEATRILVEHVRDGIPLPSHTEAGYGFFIGESCGCKKIGDEYDQSLRLRHFYTLNYKHEYDSMQDELHEKMLEAKNLDQLADYVTKSKELFGCDRVAVCFNEDFYLALESGKREYRNHGYADSQIVYDESVRVMKKKDLFDDVESKIPQGGIVLFYPLHFKERVFGFLVLYGYPQSVEEGMIHETLTMLELSIENVRVKTVLEQYNKKLDDLYVRDSLTGLYNRFGYARYGQQLFDRMREENKSIFVMFADLDKLKYINDTYGHELGDYAIKMMAEIIKENCRENEIAIRYGGDEYLMIGCFEDPAEAEHIRDKIHDSIRAFNRTHTIYFDLDISIGLTLSCPGDTRTLEECAHEADAAMYEVKKKKKMCRLPGS